MDFESLYADERVHVVAHRNLVLAAWTDAPRGKQMERFEAVSREREARVGPQALTNVAFSGTPSFDNDVRASTARLTRDSGLFFVARAHLMLIPGMAGAAVRTFLSTMILLGRPDRPTKVFGSFDDAERFLLPLLPQWTADELVATHDALGELVGYVRPRS